MTKPKLLNGRRWERRHNNVKNGQVSPAAIDDVYLDARKGSRVSLGDLFYRRSGGSRARGPIHHELQDWDTPLEWVIARESIRARLGHG